MRKMLSVGALLFVVLPAGAQEGPRTPPNPRDPITPTPAPLLRPPVRDKARDVSADTPRDNPAPPMNGVRRASTLLGMPVNMRGWADAGKVTDLVLSGFGTVDYVIVRHGDDFLAVPWGAVNYSNGDRAIVLEPRVPVGKMTGVTFREARWPDFSSEQWRRTARDVWGERGFRRDDRDRGPGARPEDRRPLPPDRVPAPERP